MCDGPADARSRSPVTNRMKTTIDHRLERRMDRTSTRSDGPRMALGAGFLADKKAHVRSRSCVWFACLSLAIGAWSGTPAPATAQQQASGQVAKPEDQRVQPKRGRDNDYTAQQMVESLIALANGPIPSRESLEREFGFEFTFARKGHGENVYSGWAGKPFAQQFPEGLTSANFRYYELDVGGVVLALNFLNPTFERTSSTLCVGTHAVSKPLQARGWVRNQRIRGKDFELTYVAEIDRVQRRVAFSPDWLNDSRCMDSFYIVYEAKNSLDRVSK